MAIILFLLLSVLVYGTSAVSIMPELKQNVLRFGYGVNFRYEGMLAHSFDRFYVVTRIEKPKVSDLNLTMFQFDYNCSHVANIEKGTRFKIPDMIQNMFKQYCKNLIPYMYLYKHQVEYYEKTVYNILEKDIGMILSKFGNIDNNVQSKCPKRQIISALISGFIGLAFEGISSYLQHKQQKALQQAMHTMNKRINIEQNRVFHLEDSVMMSGVYNVDTLEKLIQMVHKMNNRLVWYEKLYAGHVNKWFEMYSASQGANYYAIHSLLYLRTIQEKYIKMYERFVNQLKEYSHAIRILSKGYLPISLLPPSKLAKILQEVKQVLLKTNKNYGLVIKGMYKYYDMKLVMFGIDHDRNLIIQFPVFVQLYTQKPLTLYQVETIPVPILDMNKKADSYTWIRIDKPYIALNPDTYISIQMEELRMCKKIGYEYYCEEQFVVKSKAKYSCASALYFQLDRQMIKENCIFDYYYNKTDVKPSILDGGYEIVLANWPSFKRIVCSTHNNIPIEIPSHPYVLLNITVLCNCIIEVESNFLLESIAACDPERNDIDLEMYFVANTAFLNYFDELINTLDIPDFHNITRQEHMLPISLESNDFDEELLTAPETLRDLVERYKQKKISLDKQHKTLDNEKEDNNFIETSIFDHLAFNVFIFVMAIISVIVIFIVIKLIFKGEKMQTLLGNLAMIRGVKAISKEIETIDKGYLIIITWLSTILLCVLFLTIEKL